MSVQNRVGAWCWIATALYAPLHLPVVAAWPRPYDWARNYISDLGVTTCGTFSEGGASRQVCSPEHVWWNLGLGLVGLLTLVGCVLLRRSGLPRASLALLGLAGAAVVGAAALPWDVAPTAHDLSALAQAVLQLLAMVGLGWSWARHGRPGLAAVTAVCLVVSAVGMVGLVGTDHLGLGVGVVERLAFDTLTLWVVLAGVGVLRATATRPATTG